MNRKKSGKTITSLLAAGSIFFAMAASGCAVHHSHHGDGDLNRVRNARIAAGVTAGLLAIGTIAWLYSRSESEKTKDEAANEGAPQINESEKPQNQN